MDLPRPSAPFSLEVSGMVAVAVRFTPEPGAWPETWTAEEVRAATVELYRADPVRLLDLAEPEIVHVTARVLR